MLTIISASPQNLGYQIIPFRHVLSLGYFRDLALIAVHHAKDISDERHSLDRWQQTRISRHAAKVKDGREFLRLACPGLVQTCLDVRIVQGRKQNLKWGDNF